MLLFGLFFLLIHILAWGFARSFFKGIVESGFGFKPAFKSKTQQGQFFVFGVGRQLLECFNTIAVYVLVKVFGKTAINGMGNLFWVEVHKCG